MKASAFLLSLAVLLLAPCVAPIPPALAVQASEAPASTPLPVGKAFPDLTFTGTFTPETAKAFGLPAKAAKLSMRQIKTQAVIFVIYSMYCPFCQKEAPHLNNLDALIKERRLAGKITLMGMAAGNSPFEVSVFREKFGITFPLVPDEQFENHNAVGTVGTPYYYVLKRQGQGYIVVQAQLGCVTSVEGFLDEVVDKTGLAKE